MKLELDFHRGDSVICFIEGRYFQHTILGPGALSFDADGNVIFMQYEIDRKDKIYRSINMSINRECIFRTREEAQAHANAHIDELAVTYEAPLPSYLEVPIFPNN